MLMPVSDFLDQLGKGGVKAPIIRMIEENLKAKGHQQLSIPDDVPDFLQKKIDEIKLYPDIEEIKRNGEEFRKKFLSVALNGTIIVLGVTAALVAVSAGMKYGATMLKNADGEASALSSPEMSMLV